MSPETAATLDLGFDVLVPGYVPQPFAGEPAVTASEGFYSLYWVMPGTPPTFLQITGEVGGTIPDYSKHDRNVQLVENAEVQGNPAYHDLTPIYDLVYWQVGSVVYTVESHNLGDDDSLALANGLLLLAPGSDGGGEDQGAANATLSAPATVAAGEVATIDVAGGDGATLTADAGLFTGTGEAAIVVDGDSAVEWQAPETDRGPPGFVCPLGLGKRRVAGHGGDGGPGDDGVLRPVAHHRLPGERLIGRYRPARAQWDRFGSGRGDRGRLPGRIPERRIRTRCRRRQPVGR